MKRKVWKTTTVFGLILMLAAAPVGCGTKAPEKAPEASEVVKETETGADVSMADQKELEPETEKKPEEDTEAEAGETLASRLAGSYVSENGDDYYSLELFEAGGNLYGFVGEGEESYSFWAMELIPEDAEAFLDPSTESTKIGVLSFSIMSNLTKYWSSPKLCTLSLRGGDLVFTGTDGELQPVTMDSEEVVFTPSDNVEPAFPYYAAAEEEKTDPELTGLWKETGREDPYFYWFNEDGTFQIYHKTPGIEVRFGRGHYMTSGKGSFSVEFSQPESGSMPMQYEFVYELNGDELVLTNETGDLMEADVTGGEEKQTLERAEDTEIPLVVLAEPDDVAAVRGDGKTVDVNGTERALSLQFVADKDIENNGGTFVRVGDMVYFRTYDPKEEVYGLWGSFLREAAMGEQTKVSYCDLKTGETGTAFSCESTGPLWYLDGRFYSTLSDGSLCRYWPDGSGETLFHSSEYAAVSDASESNALLAVRDYPNETVLLADGTYTGSSYTRSGEDTINFVKFAGEDLFLEVYIGELDNVVLAEMSADYSEYGYGELPKSDASSWGYPELVQAERVGDRIYIGLAWFDGTMAILSDYKIVAVEEGEEGTMRTLWNGIPEICQEGSRAPYFIIDQNEMVSFDIHNPHGEAALSEDSYGDLVYYESPVSEKTVVPNLIPDYPLGKEDGEETTILQAAEHAGDSIFYILATCKRAEETDIGWRESYALEDLHFYRADEETGRTEELSFSS